jgi:hypothetical protein
VARVPNYRLPKLHRNYSVEEAATLLGVHRNTVRHWIKRGLPVVAGHPILILGGALRTFLDQQREQRKRRCNAAEIYCLRCREPRVPAEGLVEYQATGPNRGRFIALCPHCGSVMYRSANPSRLPKILAALAGAVPIAPRHIGEREQAIVNRDSEG